MTKRYEVRVEGELGRPLLHYLTWSYHLIHQVTQMRVRVTPAELERLLRACSEEGVIVERVHRVDPPPVLR